MYPENELIELLERVARRDEAALKALYDLTAPKLYGLSMRVVGDAEWAEDVLQESYLQIWRSAGAYRTSLSPPMAWLGLIVRSRSLDCLRRRSAQRVQFTQAFDDEMADTLAGDSPDPMRHALCSQEALALHQCLAKLDNRQREAVCLAYLRDLGTRELADRLKLPASTVKTRIRRGLEQLRLCMARLD